MSDQNADRLLSLAAKRAEAINSCSFSFERSLMTNGSQQKESGTVHLVKPNRIHVRKTVSSLQPGNSTLPQETISDGSQVLTLDTANRTYRLVSLDTKQTLFGITYVSPDSFSSLLGKATYEGSVNVGSQKCDHIRADVRGGGYQELLLSDQSLPVKVTIRFEAQNGVATDAVQIDDMQINVVFQKDEFLCSIPPGFVSIPSGNGQGVNGSSGVVKNRGPQLPFAAGTVEIHLITGSDTTIDDQLSTRPFLLLIFVLPDDQGAQLVQGVSEFYLQFAASLNCLGVCITSGTADQSELLEHLKVNFPIGNVCVWKTEGRMLSYFPNKQLPAAYLIRQDHAVPWFQSEVSALEIKNALEGRFAR